MAVLRPCGPLRDSDRRYTPIAAYAAAGIANSNPLRTAFAAVRFGWLAYVIPILFVLSPSLILVGDTLSILSSIAAVTIGIWLVSIAIAGYFLRPVALPMRLAFAIMGILALLPLGRFAGGPYLVALGAAGGIALCAYEILVARTRRRSAAKDSA